MPAEARGGPFPCPGIAGPDSFEVLGHRQFSDFADVQKHFDEWRRAAAVIEPGGRRARVGRHHNR
jgi:hypothetical protein